jgi:hypothetical protein
MDKEVDSTVLAVINEKRLQGDKRTPVEIIAKMGVFDARDKASEHAWLATGDQVIATIWAEFVSVGAGGRWFYLESLDVMHRVGGGERTALQVQRAKDRVQLLKRTLDAGQTFRAVLQTNRVAIADLEADKAAKVSTRVPDDQEWHVAEWKPDEKVALLVRGPRGWMPTDDELKAARARGSVPVVAVPVAARDASKDEVQTGALDYLTRHFGGYGYTVENLAGQNLGYDLQVSDKKGNILLKLSVKATARGMTSFQLSAEERAAAAKGDPWRMAVVAEPLSSIAQHKIYRSTETGNAPGLEPLLT